MLLSIIVPVLNEAATLPAFLDHLQPLRRAGHQLIVVDGGSTDESMSIAESLADRVLQCPPGRAQQMNRGAAQAAGEWLLFLHADTWLPQPAQQWLALMQASPRIWGRFNVRLSGQRRCFRLIETLMNWRSRVTGIATGDQAIFIRRKHFERLAGFAEIALMEDVELSRRLRRISRPLCLKQPVRTSSRRWEEAGVLRTTLLMWQLRLRFFLGANPDDLVRRYYPSRKLSQP